MKYGSTFEINRHKKQDAGASRYILGLRVDYTTYARATDKVINMVQQDGRGYVCISNVHMVMEAFDDAAFRDVVNKADLVTPDGMPLVWGLKLLGIKDAQRVYGPDLMPVVCARAESLKIPIGLYGGTDQVVAMLSRRLKKDFPELEIAYAFSPPFRQLTKEEDAQIIKEVIASRAKILFVGIGCVKQERWMHEHRDKIPAVMLGVGAAFDFIAEVKPQAPAWLQKLGLEWLFRLSTEPKRLWRRYLYHNPRFLYGFAKQLLTQK
ncbi:MAG: WecB/TagA/CpsF family glycosyltransferase [Pyrinomonadaceae bacterium]